MKQILFFKSFFQFISILVLILGIVMILKGNHLIGFLTSSFSLACLIIIEIEKIKLINKRNNYVIRPPI